MLSVFYSDAFLRHQTGPGHPEKPERVKAIVEALKTAPWAAKLQWQEPTSVLSRDPVPLIQKAHARSYIESVQNLAIRGGGALDPDTFVSPQSYDVALLAVNAWIDGVETVIGHHQPAFVVARPPGHHAMPSYGMGFCLFSNAAIAALYALEQPGVERVAILDWDVHHGNGTQAMVQSHANIFYASMHQFPHYPGTGRAEETGDYHNVLNVPMSAGSDMKDYESAMCDRILPFLAQAAPNLLIISAGYDANRSDPLASVNLDPQDFGTFTKLCQTITPHILMGLEGGYELEALAQSVIETIAPFMV